MDINSKRQLSQLRKEAESIEGLNFDFTEFEELIQKRGYEINSGRRQVDDELEICQTIRWLRHAISHRNHQDESVQRWVQEALEGSRHDFLAVNSALKHFISALENALDDNESKFKEPEIIVLSDGYQLEEIVSLSRLMELGNLFDNSVSERDAAKECLKEARNGLYSTWAVLLDDQPVAMFRIDLDDREVQEFETIHDSSGSLFDDEQTHFIHFEILIKIIRALDVSGDSESEFVRCGAFKSFASGVPSVEPVTFNACEWWVYYFGDEIIIGVDNESNGQLKWSNFKKSKPAFLDDSDISDWEGNYGNFIEASQLFEVVRQHPPFLDQFQKSISRL